MLCVVEKCSGRFYNVYDNLQVWKHEVSIKHPKSHIIK